MAFLKADIKAYSGIKMANASNINFGLEKTAKNNLAIEEEIEC